MSASRERGDAVHANMLVKVSAGSAEGQATYYPRQQGYDVMLRATNLHLEQLQTLKDRNLQVAGALNLTASGKGTVQDPQGQLALTIPELKIQNQQIHDINLQANVANHVGTFNLTSKALDTPLRAQGKVNLAGDYYADATFDTPVIPLAPLLAAYAPAQAAQLSGQTEVHATLRGPLKNKALLQAHVNIPTLNVKYSTGATGGPQATNVEIAAVTPIRADYVDGVLSLEPGEIKGTATDIHYQGKLPINSNAASTLKVQGAVDLALAQAFDPTITSGGQLVFDINAAGQRFDQDVEGQIKIVNARFATEDAPVGLSNGNGVLTLRRDRLDIASFSGNVGGGTVTASGGVVYKPTVQFNIGLKGGGLRLLYPQTVRSQFNVNLAMTGNLDAALLQGQVSIDRVSFTPDFDLSTFANSFSGVATPPPTEGFADNLRLNIALRSSSELNVVSPTVSIQGDANLRVIGTAARPRHCRTYEFDRRRLDFPGQPVRGAGGDDCVRQHHGDGADHQPAGDDHDSAVQHRAELPRAAGPVADELHVGPGAGSGGHHSPAGVRQHGRGGQCRAVAVDGAGRGVASGVAGERAGDEPGAEGTGHFAVVGGSAVGSNDGEPAAGSADHGAAASDQQAVCHVFDRCNHDAERGDPDAVPGEQEVVGERRAEPEWRVRVGWEISQGFLVDQVELPVRACCRV